MSPVLEPVPLLVQLLVLVSVPVPVLLLVALLVLGLVPVLASASAWILLVLRPYEYPVEEAELPVPDLLASY